MSGESYYSPSSYYTLQTSCLRTKNRAAQFPAHIFQVKQSIDSYENVSKLFTCKTRTRLYCCKGVSWEKFEMERKTGQFISLCQVIFSMFTLHMKTLTTALKMLSEPNGKKTASQGQTASIYSLFHKDEKPPEGS